VAVVIGLAFNELVKAAVTFLISPLLEMVFTNKNHEWLLDFKYLKLMSFLMAVVYFIITASVVFFLFVKPLNRLSAMIGKKEEHPLPPATLNDVVAELRELKEELRKLRSDNPPPML
jgi:large conductance mechanosensitive channel